MTRQPVAIETSEVRKRLRAVIESSRKAGAARRAKIAAAATAYEDLLKTTATPIVRTLANVLRAEGYPFTVFTPSGSLRMALEKSGDDFIEFGLDTSGDEPLVILRTNRTRGRRTVQRERPISATTPVDQVTEEDVLRALLEELVPFVER